MAGIQISEEFFKKFGKKFPPEAFLAREGEPGATMFIIQTGRVAIMKKTPAGEKVLATLKDGDFFGEMAIMDLQTTRTASAKILAETTVLELSREAFEGLIRRSPHIAMYVIKTLTERVRDANGKLASLVHKDDRIRIATYVNVLLNDKGLDVRPPFSGRCAPFKVSEVAPTLGMGADVVGAFMAHAKKARFIGQLGDWIWVPHPAYLLPFAQYLVAKNV